jgi:hypothetical protein
MRGGVQPFAGGQQSRVVFMGHIAPSTAVAAATVAWAEDLDTHTAHAAGVFTCPPGLGGAYQVHLSWKPSTAVAVAFFVVKNGSTVLVTPGCPAVAFTGMAVSFFVFLTPGDTLAFVPSGAFTTTGDVAYNTFCHIARL